MTKKKLVLDYDNYYQGIKCWNCGVQEQLKIPVGTTVEDYLDKNKCPYCGCHMRLR